MLVCFNSISNTYNTPCKRKASNNHYPNLAPLAQDTVSFGNTMHKDLMTLPAKKIILECKKALAQGLKIGEGQEAIAYKIENYPEYCIRREKKNGGPASKFRLDVLLNKYDEANHVVAKLDDGTQLMRYISGIPLKITHRDTPDGKKVKETVQALVANNFGELPFKKVIAQIEDAKLKGIDFDRKGENLHVDPLSQEMVCIDFSPNFHDIEYNPIAYVYSALGVEKSEHAPKIFGKLCKAYAQRILEVPIKKLNLEHLDTNFYHRGFMDDAFNEFPNKKVLEETKNYIENLIEAKKDPSNPKEYIEYLVQEFKEYVDDVVMKVKKEPICSAWE